MEAPQPKKGPQPKAKPRAKEWAKERAKRADRPYPNLVDNMKAAERERARKAKRQPTKDPHGGLAAAGRALSARDQLVTTR